MEHLRPNLSETQLSTASRGRGHSLLFPSPLPKMADERKEFEGSSLELDRQLLELERPVSDPRQRVGRHTKGWNFEGLRVDLKKEQLRRTGGDRHRRRCSDENPEVTEMWCTWNNRGKGFH